MTDGDIPVGTSMADEQIHRTNIQKMLEIQYNKFSKPLENHFHYLKFLQLPLVVVKMIVALLWRDWLHMECHHAHRCFHS